MSGSEDGAVALDGLGILRQGQFDLLTIACAATSCRAALLSGGPLDLKIEHAIGTEHAERRSLELLPSSEFAHRLDFERLDDFAPTIPSALPARRIAIFVDGCFWHGCPEHGTWPKANAKWWREKIESTRRRDRDTDARLAELGWTAVRIWEYEDPLEAVERVLDAISHDTTC